MPSRETQDTSLFTVIHFDRTTPQDTPGQAGPQDTPGQACRRDAPVGPAPINIEIDLEPGTTIHTEPDLGMPFVVIESGRVRINLGINAEHVSELTDEHLALLDHLAEAFGWLRDRIRSAAATAGSPDTATS